MRFLIWLIIGFAVVTWFMRLKAGSAVTGRSARQGRGMRAAAPETMLQCTRCGIHFPASEASIDAGGRAYCCEEHLAQRTG